MAKYTSGDQLNLKIGVESHSESLTALEVVGRVGIGTTSATVPLDVVGDVKVSGALTAVSFSGDGSGLSNVIASGAVSFSSTAERLELAHKATDRSIFGAGALRASLWAVKAKPGLYTLLDVLKNGG